MNPAAIEGNKHLAWNCDEVCAVLVARKASGCKLGGFFAGHCHPGGFAYVHGVPYVTLNGQLESPPLSGSRDEHGNCWAVLRVAADRVTVQGFGSQPSYTLPLVPPTLYHYAGSLCSQKVRLCLEELGLAYGSLAFLFV